MGHNRISESCVVELRSYGFDSYFFKMFDTAN